MAEYQHLILTWFNLHFPVWGGKFQGLDEAWLDRRFALFMQFCYPSVKAQTNQDFEWLVFFHVNTPPRYRATIQALAIEYPNFQPVFVDGTAEGCSGMDGPRVATRARVSKPYLITTRLCNDDSLAPGFVAAVQKQFARQRMRFIHFPNGYYLHEGSGQMRQHRYPSNFFMSLIEDARHSRRTVIDFAHNSVKGKYDFLDVEQPAPAWLVVVHGGLGANMKCGMRGKPVDPALLKVHFPFLSS